MAATRKKKVSTRSRAARKGWETRRAREAELARKRALAARKRAETLRSRAARKGWETRRAREAELARKRALAARKRAETLRRKAKLHAKRSEATKRGARTRAAKARALSALTSFKQGVDQRAARVDKLRESWHRAKRELESSVDYERYLEILDDIADEAGATEWDIAYGSTESAA